MESLGKKKCHVLKEIRKKIADANGIEYEPAECNYKGECAGTCPRCEQELRYIESELDKKRSRKKRINIAAAAIGTVILSSTALTSCNSCSEPEPTTGEIPSPCVADSDSAGLDDSVKCEIMNSDSAKYVRAHATTGVPISRPSEGTPRKVKKSSIDSTLTR